jgi:hypothetical protein
MDDLSSEARRYVRYLRRYWWILLAGAALGIAVPFVFNQLRGDDLAVVSSRHQIVVLSERWVGLSNTDVPGSMFAEDPDTLAVAVARVSGDRPLADLQQRFDVSPADLTFELEGRRVLIGIRADPETARAAGEWLMEQLDGSRVRDTLLPIELAIRAREARLDTLPSELAAASAETAAALAGQSAQLTTELELLRSAESAAATTLASEIVRQTELSAEPVISDSPSATQILTGLAAGLVLAAAGLIVWSVVDRRLTTRRDIEAIVGADSLVAVVPTPPVDVDVRAAASAVEHLRSSHPTLCLVALESSAGEVTASIAELSSTRCCDVDEILSHLEPTSYVPVARSGVTTDKELEQLKFRVDRAGGALAGVILVGGKAVDDLLD